LLFAFAREVGEIRILMMLDIAGKGINANDGRMRQDIEETQSRAAFP
jgi:hypothetical protein